MTHPTVDLSTVSTEALRDTTEVLLDALRRRAAGTPTCPSWCEVSAAEHLAEARDGMLHHERVLIRTDPTTGEGVSVSWYDEEGEHDAAPAVHALILRDLPALTAAEARRFGTALIEAAELIEPPAIS